MPRLPAPEDYGDVVPRATRGFVAIPEDTMGETQFKLGREMVRTADTFQAKVDQETQKLDELAATNALTALEQERLRLTYDPKDGFLNVQGTAILNRPLMKEVPESFNKTIEGLAAGLKNPNQQAIFRKRSAGDTIGLQRDLMRHVAEQTNNAYVQSETSELKLQEIKVMTDPELLESSLQKSMLTLQKVFDRTQPDQATKALMSQQTQANLVSKAIKGYTAGENPNVAAAQEVLRKYEDILPATMVAEMKDHLVSKERQLIATTLSNDLFEAYASGVTTVTQAEKILSEYGKTDKKLHDETRQLFYQNVQALNIQRDETKGNLVAGFMVKPSVRAKRAMMDSDEFRSLDGARKGALINFADTEIRQAIMQGRSDIQWQQHQADRAESEKEKKWFNDPEKIAKYNAILNDPDLGARKRGYGMAFAPELGATLARQIENERARLEVGAARSDYDKAIIADMTPKELLKPDKKDALNAYRGLAHSLLLDWKTSNPGRIPTEEDQKTLLQNATKEYVRDVPFWPLDKTRRAYELKPMTQDFIEATRKEYKAKGIKREPTKQELLDGWAQQKEAY